MAKTLLEQLRDVTIVVADTGDIQAIETFTPRDATTNPSLITAAAQMPEYQEIVDDTLKKARQELGWMPIVDLEEGLKQTVEYCQTVEMVS